MLYYCVTYITENEEKKDYVETLSEAYLIKIQHPNAVIFKWNGSKFEVLITTELMELN